MKDLMAASWETNPSFLKGLYGALDIPHNPLQFPVASPTPPAIHLHGMVSTNCMVQSLSAISAILPVTVFH